VVGAPAGLKGPGRDRLSAARRRATRGQPPQKVKEGTGNFGFNAATGQYGDLVAQGVVDPVMFVALCSGRGGCCSLRRRRKVARRS
jgi:hypothetical protein